MIRIAIPERHEEGFQLFIALEDNQREELISIFENLPIGATPQKASNAISQKLDLSENSAIEMSLTLFSIFSAFDRLDFSVEELVGEFIKAIKESKTLKELEISENFENQLFRLIDISNLTLTSKAIDLLTERGRILLSTRIISDVRPVFSGKDDLEIVGNLIIHNLKVAYKDNSNLKELFLALDSKDLSELKEQIIRTEKKEEKLRNTILPLDIPIIDLKN